LEERAELIDQVADRGAPRMPSKKTVAKLADDMENAAEKDFREHMDRLAVGFQLLVPPIKKMRQRGLTWREIRGVLREAAEELDLSIKEEDDARA
jgi:hypothetical protein